MRDGTRRILRAGEALGDRIVESGEINMSHRIAGLEADHANHARCRRPTGAALAGAKVRPL
jgi:hypothetical protein